MRSVVAVIDAIEQARDAAFAEDWETTIRAADQAEKAVKAAVRDLVNLARAVGQVSDVRVGQIRGTNGAAVTQRFGRRSDLLREATIAQFREFRRDHGAADAGEADASGARESGPAAPAG
jgi:hypothetical protein